VISIEYRLDLLNHMSKNGMFWDDKNILIIVKIKKASYQYILVVQGLPNILKSLVIQNNTLSKPHSRRPLTLRPIRNAENMETLLTTAN